MKYDTPNPPRPPPQSYQPPQQGQSDPLASKLAPQLHGLNLDEIKTDILSETITVMLTTTAPTANCPLCATCSAKIHSRYTRIPADLPWGTFAIRLHLRVRRFVCTLRACTCRIFTERLPELVPHYARRTTRLGDILRLVALVLGGEAGSRLVDRLCMRVSPSTMLRLIRRIPEQLFPTPRVLGVDDFARRKGQVYGTILVDLEQRRPIDLLPDRTSGTLANWLREHPGVEIISRDRSTEYTKGATQGAPQALQVADRFHIVRNLREALERILDRNRSKFVGIVVPKRVFAKTNDPNDVKTIPATAHRRPSKRSPAETKAQQARRAYHQARYHKVRELFVQGTGLRAISRQLRMGRMTVSRYLRLDLDPTQQRGRHAASRLDPYLPYLHQRWIAGCHNGAQLWREVQERGYPHSRKMVAVWVAQQREEQKTSTPTAPNTPKKPLGEKQLSSSSSSASVPLPSARSIAWFLFHDPQSLTTAEQGVLTQMKEACCEVEVAHTAVHEFLHMQRNRTPDALEPWLTAASLSDLPDLQSFAAGLEQDKAAVLASMSSEWSQGQVEGQVNRLKLCKRQMYGRANFDLLRQRVLNAT